MTRQLLYLSQEDVATCISVPEVLRIVEDVYRAHGKGQVQMPPKITLDMGECGDWPYLGGAANAMPAFVEPLNAMGLKWAAGYFDNPSRGLPSVTALIVLNEPSSGVPIAVMDGTLITDLRTGAAAAVAAKYLACSGTPEVAIIGAGRQGKAILTSFVALFPKATFRIYDQKRQAAVALAEQGPDRAKAASNAEEACKGADVIVTATTSREPIVRRPWVQDGCLVVSLGSFQELDDELTLGVDKLIVDNWEQNSHRGELAHLIQAGRLSRAHLYAELGEIIAGEKEGRGDSRETIIASLIGIGSLDIGVAKHVYETARTRGKGTTLNLF